VRSLRVVASARGDPGAVSHHQRAAQHRAELKRRAEPAGDGDPPSPRDGERRLDLLRWGLIPSFTKDLKAAPKPINARSEMAAGSGLFRAALAQRRALIPADVFFEWRKLQAGKQPYAIARRDGAPLAFAGLWEGWRSPEGETVRSYAILTTAANGLMSRIHERMPVVLEPDDWAWLGEEAGDAPALMRPAAEAVLRLWPVSRAVNSVRNNGPSCSTASTPRTRHRRAPLHQVRTRSKRDASAARPPVCPAHLLPKANQPILLHRPAQNESYFLTGYVLCRDSDLRTIPTQNDGAPYGRLRRTEWRLGMCGRFAQTLPSEAMTRLFEARDMRPWCPAPSWNVAPSAAPTTVVWDPERKRRVLMLMRWGFRPSWQKYSDLASVVPFNARCETVATSRMFAPAFARRRCLVPVTAWYEWARAAGQKVPHALGRIDGAPVAIGGIWEAWGREAWERTTTFAVVTTPASDDVRAVHHRMPLVLEQRDWATWLGQDSQNLDGATALLRPAPPNAIIAWRVSTAVSNPRNNAAELMAAA